MSPTNVGALLERSHLRASRTSIRSTMQLVAIVGLMSAISLVMLVVGMATLFRTRRFQQEVIARWLSRTILRIWGVRVKVNREGPWPSGQVVYLANHTSTLDVFTLVALGLPNTRFFLAGFLRVALPFTLINVLMGTFFTPNQRHPGRRARLFEHACRVLRRTRDSIYLSPEGRRILTGEIGKFNKGSFHLATSIGAPIVPLYIRIPRSVDPGLGFDVQPGTVEVDVLPMISTAGWRVEDVEANRDAVRNVYVRHHDRRRRP